MSIRSIVIGFLGAVLIASVGYINDHVLLLESFTNGSQLPIIVLGLLLLALVLVNPVLYAIRRQWCFRPAEFAIVVVLWSASCSIPGRGLLEQFTHSMVMPYYWEAQTPSWGRSGLLGYVGEGQLVTLPDRTADPSGYLDAYEEVVSGYVRGRSEVSSSQQGAWMTLTRAIDRVPWGAWRAPLLTWMPLVLLSGVASVCLALVTHRQWSHHEMLSYPIATFTHCLLERPEGRAFPAIMYHRLFWVGLLALLVIRINNGLAVWFPEYCIPVTLTFNLTPFGKVWPELFQVHYGPGLLYIRFFPLVIAFAFFLSSEISLTIGISNLCWVLVALPMVTMGWDLNTDWVGGWQGWERAGAYLMTFLILVYTGRNYYFRLLLGAMGLQRKNGEADRTGVWAFRGLLIAFVAMTVLVCRLGLEWPYALITVFLMLMTFVVVARISAETGMFFIQPRWTIFGLLTAGLGSFAFSPSNQIACGLVCVMLSIDQCHALLPYVTNGLKLGERSGLRPWKVGKAIFGTYAVAVCVAVLVLLVAVYEWGVPQQSDWIYRRIPTMVFRTTLPEIHKLEAVGALEAVESQGWLSRLPQAVSRDHFLFAFLFGMLGVWGFSYLRLRFPKWPLHPVLFLLWATYPADQMCHGFLIGWIIKTLCVRLGGIQLVKKLQPLMVGIISGELLSAVLFMIAGALYYWCTHEVPVSYRWFPR